jgi:hypothetical protein
MNELAHFLLLQFQRPGGELWPVAVLVFDRSNDRLYVCSRENYAGIADIDDAEVLSETVKQLQAEVAMQSGSAILDMLESTLSNSIRLTERIAFRTPVIATSIHYLSAAFLL